MSVALYQISYSDSLLTPADPDFRIYDCRDDPAPDRRETYHMWKFHKAGGPGVADHTGLLSPKFGEKAGIRGRQLIDFITARPGYDVYFINPWPQLAYLAFNVWSWAEACEPGICDLAALVLNAAGHQIDIKAMPRNTPETLLYSNYWVGNARFWREYMSFLESLMRGIETLPRAERDRIFANAAHYVPATPYYAFIFEAMFSTFLLLRPDIRGLAWPHSRSKMVCGTALDAMLIRNLGPMIDRWDAALPYGADQRLVFETMLASSKLFWSLRLTLNGLTAELEYRDRHFSEKTFDGNRAPWSR